MFFIENQYDESLEISRIKDGTEIINEKVSKNEKIEISHHETVKFGLNGKLEVNNSFNIGKSCFFF